MYRHLIAGICIRLKVLRDAMEDYEYFALLESLA